MKKDQDISKIKESFDSISNQAPLEGWGRLSKELDKGSEVDSKVRDSFLSINEEEAPETTFTAILGGLINPVDEMIKESFDQYAVSAPEGIWEKVNTQLETDLVWTKIENQIGVKSQKWRSVLTVASIVILISLVPNLLRDDQLNLSYLATPDNYKLSPKSLNCELIKIIESPNVKKNDLSSTEANQSLIVEAGAYTSNSQVKGEQVHLVSEKQIKNVTKLAAPQIQQLTNRSLPYPEIELNDLQEKDRRFSIGVIAGLNRTWVIDNETRSSFEKNSLIESKLILGSMLGITAQFDIGEKSFLTANYIVNSTSRNKLAKFNEGVYEYKTSEIRLSQISVMYGLKFSLGQQKKWSLNAKLGPYLGLINRSVIKEGDIITSYNNNFKRIDYGLNTQFAPVFYVRKFEIETGLNYELGLRNIFSGNGYISSDLNYTRNADLGIYLSLRYKL